MTKGEKGVLGFLGALAAFFGIRYLTAKPKEGDTKCVGFDFYEYRNGQWVLVEANSAVCGWQPGAAEFQLSNLIIEPSIVNIGEPVTVGVTVTNIGEKTGTKIVSLEVI